MKKIILTITLIGLSVLLNAQNSFPTENAIWNYTVRASNWLSGWEGQRNVYYTICGDTIIDSNIYSKFYTTYDTVICGENLKKFLGYFRQDDQKVYFTPSSSGQEFLLYDFGLSIGDTFHIEYAFWESDGYGYRNGYHDFMNDFGENRTVVISNIEFENGIKKIVLGSGVYDIWHEGIGSIYGLFHTGTIEALDGYSFGFSLNCLKHNDTVKYVNNPKCNQCFCPSVNIAEHSISNIINIYPNPVKDNLNIETTENTEIKSINVYTIDGKLIETSKYSF